MLSASVKIRIAGGHLKEVLQTDFHHIHSKLPFSGQNTSCTQVTYANLKNKKILVLLRIFVLENLSVGLSQQMRTLQFVVFIFALTFSEACKKGDRTGRACFMTRQNHELEKLQLIQMPLGSLPWNDLSWLQFLKLFWWLLCNRVQPTSDLTSMRLKNLEICSCKIPLST